MTTPTNLHGLPHGYFTLMMVLALGTAVYGVMNLGSVVFRLSNYKPNTVASDKLVIGFFNVLVGIISICTIICIAR
jgi:hypothetical protein